MRKIDHTTGISTVIAGIGTSGFSGDSSAATSAQLNTPKGVAVDSSGNMFIADTTNHRIRKIDTNGNITTIAGTGTAGYDSSQDGNAATSAKLSNPTGIAVDASGNIYIVDTSNLRIRKIDTGGTPTIWGITSIL